MVILLSPEAKKQYGKTDDTSANVITAAKPEGSAIHYTSPIISHGSPMRELSTVTAVIVSKEDLPAARRRP